MTFIPNITNTVDTNNSTTTILAENAEYTGTATNCTIYSSIDISVYSNVNSAPFGLEVQSSTDGTSNWNTYFSFTVSAGQTLYRSVNIQGKYYRIKYTNGSTGQTEFRLQTILGIQNPNVDESQKQSFIFTAQGSTGSSGITGATSQISMDTNGFNGFAITVNSIGGNTANAVVGEVSADDGLTWFSVPVISFSTNNSTSSITGVSAVDSYYLSLPGGTSKVRARCSNYVSGTITGTLSGTSAIPNFTNIRSFVNVLSTLNSISNTQQLNANATFTGQWEADLLWQGASMTIYSDQNLTIQFQQSAGSTSGLPYTPHSVDTYTYTAGSTGPDSSKLFNLVSNYHRVVVTNTGSTATTTLWIQTYTTPNWAPIPARGFLPLDQPIKSNYDSTITRSIITGQTDSGNYLSVPVTSEGHLECAIHAPLGPFGSVHTENFVPVIQQTAVYGINSNNISITYGGTGATGYADDSVFVASCGNVFGAYASIQTVQRITYRPGQGLIALFSGRFPNGGLTGASGYSGSYQLIGIGHAEDGVYFGYRGATFGILYVNRGKRQIMTLTVTGASGSIGSTASISFPGLTAYTIPLGTTNTTEAAYQIASYGGYTGWDGQAFGNTVVFVSGSAGNYGGTGGFGLTGNGNTGTWTLTRGGASATEAFYQQSSWNMDVMDGTRSTSNPSGILGNWQKGNVFEIGIEYLGFGTITFSVEGTATGNNSTFNVVHSLNLPNTLSATSFRNPSFPLTMVAYGITGGTGTIQVESGSLSAFNEGITKFTANKYSYTYSNTSATAITTSTLRPIYSIQNGLVFGGIPNQTTITCVSIGVVCRDATNYNSGNGKTSIVIYLIKNAILSGSVNFSSFASTSSSYLDTGATGISISNNSKQLFSMPISANSSQTFAFTDEITLQPGDILTICAATLNTLNTPSVAQNDLVISLNTRENY
jgi:hypothetical protein